MSIKSFFLKKAVQWKMKGVPQAQQDLMLAMVEKNPQLFKSIGEEIERRKKAGESEMKATLEVMKKYRTQLAELQGGSPR